MRQRKTSEKNNSNKVPAVLTECGSEGSFESDQKVVNFISSRSSR